MPESGQSLKRRLRGVQNIGTITKAMELVAATKMRKSQELALTSRPYAYSALELLGVLSKLEGIALPDTLCARRVVSTAFLLIPSDKGLAGSFNSVIIRKFEQSTKSLDLHDPQYSFIAIGQKAKTYLERRKLNIIKAFVRVSDFTKIEEVEPISNFLLSSYTSGAFESRK